MGRFYLAFFGIMVIITVQLHLIMVVCNYDKTCGIILLIILNLGFGQVLSGNRCRLYEILVGGNLAQSN